MSQHGGKRPGAGRPKGTLASHTLEAQELRKQLIQAAKDNWQAIVFTLIDKAVAGDTIALRELLDRVLGKATTPIELDSKSGLPFQIVIKQIQSGEVRS
jgi:hypothetical protein